MRCNLCGAETDGVELSKGSTSAVCSKCLPSITGKKPKGKPAASRRPSPEKAKKGGKGIDAVIS